MTSRFRVALLCLVAGCGGQAATKVTSTPTDATSVVAKSDAKAESEMRMVLGADNAAEMAPSWTANSTSPVARYLPIPLSIPVLASADYTALGVASTRPGDTLRVATLWCIETLGAVSAPAPMTCSAEAPTGAREGHIATSNYESWRQGMESCGVRLADRPARSEEIAALKPELRWNHGQGLASLKSDELIVVNVYHQERLRQYKNVCSGRTSGRPCTPNRSAWATDDFEIAGERIAFSQYTIGPRGRRQLESRRPSYVDVSAVAYGTRRDGWFVADPIFDTITSDAATPQVLHRAQAHTPNDLGDELALRLSLFIVAARIADASTQAFAADFVSLADKTDLSKLHHELAPQVRKALPLARGLASGDVTVSGPCASSLP